MAWNESLPDKTSAARDIDIYIRDQVKKEVRAILDLEHRFYADPTGHTDNGQHRKGSARLGFGLIADRPAVNADNPGKMYIDKTNGQFYYDDGVAWSPAFGYLTPDQNADFRQDSNGDGIPDGWTFTAYTGGTGALVESGAISGGSIFRIARSIGTSNGGGMLTSDYLPLYSLRKHTIRIATYSTLAGLHNKVTVTYYSSAKESLGVTETLYDSTTNPTSPTEYIGIMHPPSTARFCKLSAVGGDTDVNIDGATYFGLLKLNYSEYPKDLTFSYSNISGQALGTSWVDVASLSITNIVQAGIYAGIYLNINGANLTGNVTVISPGYPGTFGARLRIGSSYSNTVSGYSSDSSSHSATGDLTIALTTLPTTVYLQVTGTTSLGYTNATVQNLRAVIWPT